MQELTIVPNKKEKTMTPIHINKLFDSILVLIPHKKRISDSINNSIKIISAAVGVKEPAPQLKLSKKPW